MYFLLNYEFIATQHSLVTNCLHCGKILCELEGGSVCTFCGTTTGIKTKRSPQMTEELQRAIEHKNKLLNYSQTGAQRTVVWGLCDFFFFHKMAYFCNILDDQADYYAISNWMTPEERERIKKQEEKMRAAKDKSNRKTKLIFDFAGRKVIATEGTLKIFSLKSISN